MAAAIPAGGAAPRCCLALVVAFVITTPVNRALIARGKGHPVVHKHHPSGHGSHP